MDATKRLVPYECIGGDRVFIDNTSVGNNKSQSGSVYTLLGSNQTPDSVKLPSLAGRNNINDPLLDFGTSDSRIPFFLEWVSSINGAGR